MLKTLSLNKIIKLPTLKMKNNSRVYDKEWHMWFDCEAERQEFVNAIENDGIIGNISELYDSKKPQLPKGALAQAWSVAEVFRIILEK